MPMTATQKRARVPFTALIATAATLAALTYAYSSNTEPSPPREGRTVVRVVVTSTHGPMRVRHTSTSTVHGERLHSDPDGTYVGTYALDTPVQRGETLRTAVTVTVSVDTARRRTLECVIMENGKPVTGPRSQVVRRESAQSSPLTCTRTTQG